MLGRWQAFRSATLRREPKLGIWLSLGAGAAAEMAALCSYDWALIDREHGAGDYAELTQQLWALQAGPTAPIVRVSHNDAAEIKRVMDTAPAGIMVPNVSSAAEASAASSAFRLPPDGERGAATSTRSSLYGYGYHEYAAEANTSLLLVVQIESLEAVLNVDSIAATPGVDVLFVGPTDLGISLREKPRLDYEESLSRVAAAARTHGKAAGILARKPSEALEFLERGFTFVSCGSDRGMLAAALRDNARALGRFKAPTARRTPE